MSMSLMVDAMKLKIGNPTRKLVLIKLADNANDNGICWPSYDHIAEQCEISRRTAIRQVKELVDMGLIKVTYREGEKGNSTNIYKLSLGGDKLTPPSDIVSLPSDPVSPPPSDRMSPRTSHSFEPVNEPKKINKKVSGISLESLPEQISKQVAKDFIDHRKALKKPLTQKAFELAMSSAIKCVGVTPDQAIDICIERGWQTPRPEWIANHLNSSRSNHQTDDIDFNSTGWGADLNVR